MSSRLFPVAAVIDIEDTLPAVGSIYGLDPFMDYHLGGGRQAVSNRDHSTSRWAYTRCAWRLMYGERCVESDIGVGITRDLIS